MPRTALLAEAAAATAKAGDLPTAIELTRQLIAEPGAIDLETYELARSSLRWYLWEVGRSGGRPRRGRGRQWQRRRRHRACRATRAKVRGQLAEGDGSARRIAATTARWQANALAHRAGLLLYLRRTDGGGPLRARGARRGGRR